MDGVRDVESYLNEHTTYSQHCLDYLNDFIQVCDILFQDFCKGIEASDL